MRRRAARVERPGPFLFPRPLPVCLPLTTDKEVRTMSLTGKVALVTGAQQGIGRATALALARAGADVGVNYLDDPDGASAVAREITAMGRRATLVQGDVSMPAHVEAIT